MMSEASSTAPIRVTLVMMIASAVVALGSEVAATRVVRMSPLVRPVKVVTVSKNKICFESCGVDCDE